MKITYSERISNEKSQEPPHWADYKHYHKLEVFYYNGELKVEKELWYITGHGGEEVDKIFSKRIEHVVYKTHDINKLTPELEKEMINQIIKNIDADVISTEKIIRDQNKYIKYRQEDKANLLKSKYFRENKLKRILNED